MKKLDPSEFWFEDILKSKAATDLCLRWEIRREKIKRGVLNIDDSYEGFLRPYMDWPLSEREEKESFCDLMSGNTHVGKHFYDQNPGDWEKRWRNDGSFIRRSSVQKGTFRPMWLLVDQFRSDFKEMVEAIDSAEKDFFPNKVTKKENEKRMREWEEMMDRRFSSLRVEGFVEDYRAFFIDWDLSKENLIKEFTDYIDEAYETHGHAPVSLPGGGDPYRKMRADLVHLARARLWKFYAGNIDKCHLAVGESTSEYAKKILASERTYNNSLDRTIELCESEEYQW